MVTLDGATHVPWDAFYSNVSNVNQMLDFLFEHMDLGDAECPRRISEKASVVEEEA